MKLLHHAPRILLLAGLGVAPLLGQNALSDATYEVKVRGGMTFGNLQTDLNARKLMGLSAEGFFPLFGKGGIAAQVDYTYFPGSDYDNMPPATFDGRALSAASSADRRKLSLEGFSLRAAYRAPIMEGLSWQAGLIINRFKATEEVSGTLRPAGTTSTGYESLAYTPQSSKVTPGLFAGVKYQVNNVFSLEANVIGMSYGTVKWQPYWYTGQNSATSGNPVGAPKTQNRSGFALEFAAGLRL